ncbi:MAG: peptide chain release factor N(5)-glutamine methyltransferase [Lewinella sp.]
MEELLLTKSANVPTVRTDDLSKHFIRELKTALGAGEAASVTRLVMEDVFGYRQGNRPRMLTDDEELLAWVTLNRLHGGEPVQYVTGIADFYGLQLKVTPAVLIPRPETEELVEWILDDHPTGTSRRIVDLGTGSGCIPLAIQDRRPEWVCEGVDVSQEALEVATKNQEALQSNVIFKEGDVLEGRFARDGLYDIIVSNPPYIPPSERKHMGDSVLVHEPDLALFVPEEDPLVFYRKIGEIGLTTLRSGGYVYVETNEYNSDQVMRLFRDLGYNRVERRKDLQGKWRMVRVQLED